MSFGVTLILALLNIWPNLMTPLQHGNWQIGKLAIPTRGFAIAEGPRDAVVSRNSVTTKHPIKN